MNQIAQAWWSWMGPMLWQVSLLILIVTVIDLLVGKWAWPPVRYALWLLILVKLLIPPTWSMPTSLISQSVPWARTQIVQLLDGEPNSAEQKDESSPATTPAAVPATGSHAAMPATATGPSSTSTPTKTAPVWQTWLMGIWILGMVLFTLLLSLRMAKLRRWHREQVEKRTIPPWFHELMVQTARRIKLERLPAIVFSAEAVTPAVYGVFRPVLLLPANYTEELSREEAEHVLLHELAHLKRGDLWLHGLCLLLQIVYWFNPLLIWVRKQTRHVRELCCDLTIAGVLREKTARYRKTLLDTARELLTESLEPGMGLLGVFEEPFRLVARLRWLEQETWRKRRTMIAASILVVLIMVPFVLPMAAVEQPPAVGATTELAAAEAADRPAGAAGIESCFREETRWERYFLLFRTDSDVRAISEFWLGDGRAALIEDRFRVILERERDMITFINPRERTYVEIPLPVDLSAVFSDELKRQRRDSAYGASVKPTGETRRVKGYGCDEYEVTQWNVEGGVRKNFRTAKVYATTEVDVDITLAEQLLDVLRVLHPRDQRSREELRKIRGKQLLAEFEGPGGTLVSEKIVSEVVEIRRTVPSDDIYTVPANYTRKEQISVGDI
jgi:beta-lactamase regulating signal transducer with metallopeptidase domain